ncbi:MAG: hypothetical protein RRC07_02200 [Anaerolineae bacterium]|nr:hypothetical protein [Anaerolineae bacterium]
MSHKINLQQLIALMLVLLATVAVSLLLLDNPPSLRLGPVLRSEPDTVAVERSARPEWTLADVAAIEREVTYTTAEDVAAGKRAADRYWLTHVTIYEVAAAEREFTYTTAEDVQKGKAAAEAFWQKWEATH